MKKDTGNQVKLGMFILLGIMIFIIGIYYVGERQQLFRSTFRISGVFKDVGGLQTGNNVRFSGINVGTIENISVASDTSVRVYMLIEESTRQFIKKDAVASIGSEGLMGNKILIITPGTGGKKEIENNDIVETIPPINLDDILVALKTTVTNTSNITTDLAKITGNIQSGKGVVNMDDILKALKVTMDNASDITSDVSKITHNIQSGKGTIGRLLMDSVWRQNFDSSIVNLKQGSEGIKNLFAKNNFVQNVDSTFMNLKEGSDNLKQGLGGIKTLMDSVNSSYVRNIDSTFLNLKKASAELEILLEKAKHSWLLWGF
jgi:phospholipid/cholesterol/gamma-HCH transport system substrate-binding protein